MASAACSNCATAELLLESCSICLASPGQLMKPWERAITNWALARVHSPSSENSFRVANSFTSLIHLRFSTGRWRSEERRVGKECRYRWSPYELKETEYKS